MARPDRPVLAVIGDGSLQYTVQALWTAARYQVPVTVLILNNGEYGILKDWTHRLGSTSAPGLDLPGIDVVAIARGYGLHATRVQDPQELRQALEKAYLDSVPAVIEVPLARVPYGWGAESEEARSEVGGA
jgi:benzoylformate decarboxylase